MIYKENRSPYIGNNEHFILSYRNQREATAAGQWAMVLIGFLLIVIAFFFVQGQFIGIRGFELMIGVMICYSNLTLIFNKKEIWIKNDRLTMFHKPLPFFTRHNNLLVNKIINAEVYRRESRYGSAYDVGLRLNSNKVVTFAVASNLVEAEYIVGKINDVLKTRSQIKNYN